MTKKIKEQEEIEIEDEEENPRANLNIQQFFNDMRMLGDQLRDRDLVKPVFDSGAPEVTNYLLWLCLAELMNLNDKLNEEEQ